MIITADDIREIRPVAQNIDQERINIYIEEAERLDLQPAIGVEMCERLQIEKVGALDESLTLLYHGGTYTDCNGRKDYCDGIRKALSYLAYSRFVRNHPVNATAFGVVAKYGDESDRVDDRTLSEVSRDAYRIGMAYVNGCVKYMRVINARCECGGKPHTGTKRFMAIGD